MLLIVGSFKKMTTFATANEKDWFLGFESARNLNNPSQIISERDFLLGTLGTSIV